MAFKDQERERHDVSFLHYLVYHGITGLIAGWVFMLGLIWTNVGQIGALLDWSCVGLLGLLMLIIAFGSTGAAVGIGVATMALGAKQDD